MDIYIIIVFICLSLSFVILFTKETFKDIFVKIIFKVCVFIGVLKYISLLIFYSVDSPKFLYDLRLLPLLSLITLFILGYIMIYFILEKKFNLKDFGILFILFILSTYIIYNVSFGISNSEAGYVLVKNAKWIFIESLYIILICVVFIAISLKAVFNTNVVKTKMSFLVITIAFIGVLVEEGMVIMNKTLFHFNIVGDLSILIMIILIFINLKVKRKENT